MNFGELRDDFRLKLNRRDITPTQVDAFIFGAIQRTQRLLRVPTSERSLVVTVAEAFQTLPIPGDYLKLVSLTTGDGHELRRVDLSTASEAAVNTGRPQWFCRDGAVWVIGPKPCKGTILKVVYHSDAAALVNAEDSNWLTEIAPDIIVNGALSAALRAFVDPRRDSYEGDFLQAITDLNVQASDDELVNAAVTPVHSFGCW